MRIHFIGVCGTAMATLAAMLKARGHDVQGSDLGVYPPMSDFLVREGIRTFEGYRAEQITSEIELVVVGNAISRGNPELEEVLDRKIRFTSLPALIRDEFLWNSQSVVIAGTHGKTTTTALTGWLLTACGRDPSVLVGGISVNLDGSYRLGGGRAFVIEGDEYDSAFFDKTAKFLKYLPDIAVVANLEYDHADIYADMESLRTAFRRFVAMVPRRGRLIVGADNAEAARLAAGARCEVDTFGFGNDVVWRASNIRPVDGQMAFDLTHRGEPRGSVRVPLVGGHNVQNALAAMAAGHAAGLDVEEMIRAMEQFRGVRRRLELRGNVRGVSVFDDFAHHPTAILETLRAVRWSYPDRRVWAVFEPRSATSCRRVFQDDFVRAFAESKPDEVILASIFRSSLPEDERLSVDDIVSRVNDAGGHARHIGTVPEIVSTIASEARDGDLVIIMSNGGFDNIHDKLLAALAGGSRVTMATAEFADRLRMSVPALSVDPHAPLAPLTTFGVGGPADWLITVHTAGELGAALAAARDSEMPVTILGGGSNVVVADEGIRGAVVRLKLTEVTQPSTDRVRAEAGVTMNGLVRWTIGRGLAALEAWAGTPGTVGGAIYGNAHYGGRNIGDLVSDVCVISRDGVTSTARREDMEFAYDTSRLKRTGEILVWAEFAVHQAHAEALRATARKSLAFRKGSQPLAFPSAGCMFQNPDPARDRVPEGIPPSAGALIDRAGLKGKRIGGAMISPVHANFFVSDGTARAADIYALAAMARTAVRDQFGVELRDEIVYLGSF